MADRDFESVTPTLLIAEAHAFEEAALSRERRREARTDCGEALGVALGVA
jgi:hypothetical protein